MIKPIIEYIENKRANILLIAIGLICVNIFNYFSIEETYKRYTTPSSAVKTINTPYHFNKAYKDGIKDLKSDGSYSFHYFFLPNGEDRKYDITVDAGDGYVINGVYINNKTKFSHAQEIKPKFKGDSKFHLRNLAPESGQLYSLVFDIVKNSSSAAASDEYTPEITTDEFYMNGTRSYSKVKPGSLFIGTNYQMFFEATVVLALVFSAMLGMLLAFIKGYYDNESRTKEEDKC